VAKRYLIPNRAVAKGVQLRLLRQRVVMAAQKAQADVPLHRLQGWNAAAERHDAQDEFHSAAQARWAGSDFDADHGLAFDGVGRSANRSRARGPKGVWAAAVRAPLLRISPQHPKKIWAKTSPLGDHTVLLVAPSYPRSEPFA
jgi:hypothetical protein